MPPNAPSSTPVQLPRQRTEADDPTKLRPIPGMKVGWSWRPSDRTIHYRATKDHPLALVGTVPDVTGVVSHLTDDGEDIRIEYQVRGRRQRRKRILTEDELDRGTWAAKLGAPRPSGSDARLAFATVIRQLALAVDEVPARAYYEDGNLILPDADAQTFGYLVTEGTEANAREAWREIGEWARDDPKACLVLGVLFVGPILERLGTYAHMVNLIGPGQQGKSTALKVSAATLGTIRPRRQQVLITWNSSKQGITQSLRSRGYLSVAIDEHSSSGRTPQQATAEFSQIVAGAMRSMGGPEGSMRELDGFWYSTILSSSNQPLKFAGQSEDLASRLHEISAPFFPHAWVNTEGTWADPRDGAAEHVSKRLVRLAESAGGWPLVWAQQRGMFKAANLEELRRYHGRLQAAHAPRVGGIPDTIADMHMSWVVGAHMLGSVIGIDLAERAEQAAAERLHGAIEVAAQANVPTGVQLWNALDALRIEAYAYPPMDEVVKAAASGFHKVKGFTDPESGHWWVVRDVVQAAAASEGIENTEAALHQLHEFGVLVRESTGNHLTYQLPRPLRGKGLPARMHRFDTRRAADLWAPDDAPDDSGTTSEGSGTTPGTTQVVPDSEALTSAGTTGTTGTTSSAPPLHTREGGAVRPSLVLGVQETLESTPAAVADEVDEQAPVASRRRDATAADVATIYPPATVAVTDQEYAALEARAEGRARGALRFGVLGADEAGGPALHLPNHAPVPVRLPESVNAVPALMEAYGLRTLWVHESAALAMGLPTLEERRASPALNRVPDPATDDDEEPDAATPPTLFTVGPQTPTAHAWMELDPAGPIVDTNPGGLASWLTLVTPITDERELARRQAKGESENRRLSVALPMYDTRYNKDRRIGGFGGAEDPAALLDALMVWSLATASSYKGRTQVIPFYASVNRTAQDFARIKKETAWCDAVRGGEIEPLGRNAVRIMVPQQWGRPLTEAERKMAALHRFDKTAAWLGAFGACPLGVGEPVHAGVGAPFAETTAGFWRVAEVPGTGPAGLPELHFSDAEDGGHWLSTPSLNLLRGLYPAWSPEILEAWYWEHSSRVMETGMYDTARQARERIVAHIAAGRPGARWSKQMIGRVYQSFRGYMARTSGPMTDFATGGSYSRDIYYRPDWARLILDLGTANMYRNLVAFAAEGVYPVAVCVDALTFASDEADPMAARPAAMLTGKARWTHEGSAPLAALLPALDDSPDRPGRVAHAHHVLNDYLKTPGE